MAKKAERQQMAPGDSESAATQPERTQPMAPPSFSTAGAGVVDRVLAIQESGETEAEESARGVDGILALLHARTGHDFRCYKKKTIKRRIARRMSAHHIEALNKYHELLRKDADEVEELFADMLISVTSFFREPDAWRVLEENVLPKLVERSGRDGCIRVWAPGCATGEECYSVGMLLIEALGRADKHCGMQIFGTDIDWAAQDRARTGVYPVSIEADVPQHRLRRFFEKHGDSYTVSRELRESVTFAPQSLIKDPPFSKLDLIVCRNLLIYLENAIQANIIRLFHFALNEGGYLFLGNSEGIGAHSRFFRPISKSWRIYQK